MFFQQYWSKWIAIYLKGLQKPEESRWWAPALDAHTRREEHQILEEKMTNFLKTRRPGNDISARLQRQAAEQQHRTMKGVLSIIDVVITLGQRGIPLRGNFSVFVDWNPNMIQNSKTI